MNILMRKMLHSIIPILIILIVSQASFAQTSLEIKGLLRQGMKECRAAKTLRRTDLQGALEKFQDYRALVEQALEIDETILGSNDTTVRRVLDFCNGVKADLDRAEALPLFERGLVECREARVSLANGAFDEARDSHGMYIQFKESAIALTESVLNVYENSYELRLCEQLDQDIAQAELDYKRQLTSLAANQQKVNEVISLYTEALSQCQGAQRIINDKARYTGQTSSQVTKLFTDARATKKGADDKYKVLLASDSPPETADRSRIDTLATEFNNCGQIIPNGIALINRTVQTSSRTKPDAGGSTSQTTATASKLKDSNFTQIVGARPKFPMRALRRNIQGYVVVRYTVSKEGEATNIEIVESKPKGIFDKSAINAVKKYKFQPRISQGVPVDTPGVEKKITFKLASG